MNVMRYETLAKIAMVNYEAFKDDPETLHEVTGLVAEGLHRTTPIHTGLISIECNNRPKGTKVCREHYFGRLASAKLIMRQIAKGKSFNRIVALIKSRSRVHYTTSDENNRLRKHGDMFWREAYKKAGIVLVPFVDRKIKKIDIGGLVFSSAKEVSYEFDIPIDTVRQRVKSSSKKWADWNYA